MIADSQAGAHHRTTSEAFSTGPSDLQTTSESILTASIMADNAITPDLSPGEKMSHTADMERRASVPYVDINENLEAK